MEVTEFLIGNVRIRTHGTSKVAMIEDADVKRVIKRVVENAEKLPVFVKKEGERLVVTLPVREDGKLVYDSDGIPSSIWRLKKNYAITIPKSIADAVPEGIAEVTLEGNKMIISPSC